EQVPRPAGEADRDLVRPEAGGGGDPLAGGGVEDGQVPVAAGGAETGDHEPARGRADLAGDRPRAGTRPVLAHRPGRGAGDTNLLRQGRGRLGGGRERTEESCGGQQRAEQARGHRGGPLSVGGLAATAPDRRLATPYPRA